MQQFILLVSGVVLAFFVNFTTSKIATPIQPEIISISEPPVLVCDRVSDSLALIELYFATFGGTWANQWSPSQPISSWYGVEVDENGCVKSLDLSRNRLRGTIPDLALPNLTTLDLEYNELVGNIPDFSDMPLLKSLSLNNNDLIGAIPDFSNLPLLRSLFLGANELSGPIPDFSNLPELWIFSILNNSFNDTLPNFSNLPKLYSLNARSSQLIGEIPNFSNFPDLESLSLGNNQLSGDIPELSSLTSLRIATLHNNNLDGNIPDFSNASDLVFLELSGNQLTFEDIIPNYDPINALVTANSATGAYLITPQQKTYSDTSIVGTIGNPVTVDLLIDDTVSTNTYQWYKNDILYQEILGDNELTINDFQASDSGIYHCIVTNPNIPELSLLSRDISITLPDLECRTVDSLTLVDLYNATDGPNWINTWDLNLPMDTWHGIQLNGAGCVESIKLQNNGLSGTLPALNLSLLNFLSLSGNSINGDLPDFSNLIRLKYLYLDGNNLTGIIPSFSNLPKLEFLGLSVNDLTGNIPNFDLPLLRYLNLSNNDLQGTVPDFTGIPQLDQIYLENNALSGTLPPLLNLPKMRFLNFSENQLSGEVPDFSNFPELSTIRLSNNQLTGCPPELSASSALRSIYIENNNLSCSIPSYANSPLLRLLYLDANLFTFEDILATIDDLEALISNNAASASHIYRYTPQAKFYADTTITKSVESPLTIDLLIDDTVSTNLYQWYKDDILYQEIQGENELTFNDLQLSDAGIYHCIVTNPNAPDLSLMSRNITLNIEEIVLPECEAEDLTLNQNPIPSAIYQAADTIQSTGIVEASADVTFIAGNTIRLLPDFHAEAGALFQAYIDDCELPAQASIQDLPRTTEADQLEKRENLALTIFPNPSKHSTNLQFQLPESTSVHLFISDLNGRIVQVIKAGENQDAGSHQHQINLSDLSGGIYNVHLLTPIEKVHRRMVVIE